jgi:hypothetical protein
MKRIIEDLTYYIEEEVALIKTSFKINLPGIYLAIWALRFRILFGDVFGFLIGYGRCGACLHYYHPDELGYTKYGGFLICDICYDALEVLYPRDDE